MYFLFLKQQPNGFFSQKNIRSAAAHLPEAWWLFDREVTTPPVSGYAGAPLAKPRTAWFLQHVKGQGVALVPRRTKKDQKRGGLGAGWIWVGDGWLDLDGWVEVGARWVGGLVG